MVHALNFGNMIGDYKPFVLAAWDILVISIFTSIEASLYITILQDSKIIPSNSNLSTSHIGTTLATIEEGEEGITQAAYSRKV